MIERSGQYVMPSPYAGQRPISTRRRSPRSRSARRRDATCRCRVRRRSSEARRRRAAAPREGVARRRSSGSRPISGRSSRRRIAGASGSKPSSRKPPLPVAVAPAACRTIRHVERRSESRSVPRRAQAARRRRRVRRRPRRAVLRAGDDLAGGDATARSQPERRLAQARDELGGRPKRALRIVLMRDRGTEHGEHGVAARLDHDAVVLRADRDGGRRGSARAPCAATRRRRPSPHPRAARRRTSPGASRRRQRLAGGRGRRADTVGGPRGAGSPTPARADPGRLDTQAVDQRLVRTAVGLERLGLPPGAVQREHLPATQPLAQRMLPYERLELADQPGVAAAGEVRVDPIAEACQAQVLQPRDLRLREAGVGNVGERGAAPQRERLPERRRRLPRLAGGELGATVADESSKRSASSSPGAIRSAYPPPSSERDPRRARCAASMPRPGRPSCRAWGGHPPRARQGRGRR